MQDEYQKNPLCLPGVVTWYFLHWQILCGTQDKVVLQALLFPAHIHPVEATTGFSLSEKI